MSKFIRFRLSSMMFMEFFIWGSWFVTLGTFLNANLQASGSASASVFGTQSWGAIIAPFIVGLIADRYFNAEKILALLHLLGGVLMYMMYSTQHIDQFYPYVLAYMILFMPTLSLVNSIAFNQMANPEREFAKIRVWGTIGWIVAGIMISFVFHWDSGAGIANGFLKYTFLMASAGSFLLAAFSLILPKTPPKISSGEKVNLGELLGIDAFKMLKDKNFLVFFVSAIMICIPLAFYYQNAGLFLSSVGLGNPTGKMAIGQASEALLLLAIPYFFSRFGFKKTIMLGMLAWVLRYLLFAYGNGDSLGFMLITGIALHGICYDFFFVSGQIYTNSKAGEKFKSSAQGLITLATYGIGMLIGFEVAGLVTDHYQLIAGIDWKAVWLIPSAIAAIVLIIFGIFFNEKINKPTIK